MPTSQSATAETSDVRPAGRGGHRGKYVIAALAALGLIGAGGGWLYHRQTQKRAIAFWGSDAAALIVSAPEVEVAQLVAGDSPPDATADTVAWAGKQWQRVARADATRAAGMPHLRRRLVQDDSFDWSATPADHDLVWQYALRFSDRGKRATVLFDADCQWAALAETGATVCVAPLARGLRTVLPGFFPVRGADFPGRPR